MNTVYHLQNFNLKALFILIICIGVAMSSCSKPEPRPIEYGKDQCAHCRMGISDKKFGSEAIMNTGKMFVFDAPECMIAWYESGAVNKADVQSLWVTEFIHPETLIDARTATYLESRMIRSPMGLNVAAFRDSVSCERAEISFDGSVRTFDEVVTLATN